jgi:hypothetical protein
VRAGIFETRNRLQGREAENPVSEQTNHKHGGITSDKRMRSYHTLVRSRMVGGIFSNEKTSQTITEVSWIAH